MSETTTEEVLLRVLQGENCPAYGGALNDGREAAIRLIAERDTLQAENERLERRLQARTLEAERYGVALEAALPILEVARRAASEGEPYWQGIHASHVRDVATQARQALKGDGE